MSLPTENIAQDRSLINLDQAHEVLAWSQSLECSEEALRAAVQAVGHSPQAVRSYLAHRSAQEQGSPAPMADVSASGSARELGYDYGGERLEGQQLSSRQGAELIGEKRRMDADR